MTERRLSGEPLDNILGYREFFGREFDVSTDVLSPRDDTEVLVRRALKVLEGAEAPRVLDLGTGSGAIAVTLAAERRDAQVTATDVSAAALAMARQNASKFAVSERVRFVEGSWFEPLPAGERFDLIVSNPPYIDDTTMGTLEREVRDFDPDVSLRGGPDGLVAYRAILAEAANWLKAGAPLIVEIGYDQGESVPALLARAGFAHVSMERDLAGHPRVVMGRSAADGG